MDCAAIIDAQSVLWPRAGSQVRVAASSPPGSRSCRCRDGVRGKYHLHRIVALGQLDRLCRTLQGHPVADDLLERETLGVEGQHPHRGKVEVAALAADSPQRNA